jgi:uncharacterized protein (TIGR00255 family)
MNSMTGFGRGSAAFGSRTFTVQVNSVNRRGLDLGVTLPAAWSALEGRIADETRRAVTRGKVQVVVELEGAATKDGWDATRVREALERLRSLAAVMNVAFQPTPELLWQIARDLGDDGKLPEAEAAWVEIAPALRIALTGFKEMRAREGGALLADFLARIAKLREHVEAISVRAPEVVATYRELLNGRLRAAGLELDVSDERVLKEVALLADRIDISEEITRLRSHLGQLTDLLRGEGEVGRKAEFILQEIGREIHTIGSKANDLSISQRVIDFKNEHERIREQIANVE